MKSVKFNPLTSLVMAAALAIGLAGCGGGSDTMPDEPPPPTALETATGNYDMAKAAYDALTDASTHEARVAAAEALSMAAAALAAATAADSSSTASDLAAAQMKASEAASALSMAQAAKKAADEMAAADAELAGLRTDYSDAVAAYDALGEDASNAARLSAAQAIHAAAVALRDELRSRNAPVADVEMAEGYVTMAQMKVGDADKAVQDERAADARRTAQLGMITTAITEARTAVGMVNDASTDEEVAEARAAVANAKAKIAEAADVADDVKATHTASVETLETSLASALDSRKMVMDASEDLADQRMAISDAIDKARMAVAAVMDDSDDAVVEAAMQAISDARVAIAGASDVPDEEKAANSDTVGEIMAQLETAKMSRMAAMEAAEKEADAEKAAMAATAAKLYDGISRQMGDPASPGTTDRSARYDTTNESTIEVFIGDGTNTAVAVPLSEDKDAMVAANHGWAGKRYIDPAGGDMYEAVVYSNVGPPTEGKKFGSAAAVANPPTGDYQYQLTNGALLSTSFVASRVAFTGVTRTAGTETFKLPDPNRGSATVINIPGSYHGVSGTYDCTPATPANGCSAAVAAEGFTVSSGDTWMFRPSNAEARVMESADTMYASYGWWLRKAANDGPFTASAFHDEKGGVADATGLDALNGTATYMGGAAGKYALASSTGGTNDAGHFTARARLEANFTKPNTDATAITGTIDMFVGADGQSRDWEVTLKGSTIGDTGVIGNDGTSTTSPGGTVWTIDEDAADATGQWSGTLRNNGTDNVPQVATGTFYTEYGTAGKMVGAFGANKQ